MLQVVCNSQNDKQSPRDADEVQCIPPMWQKYVQSVPSSYASSLAVLSWKGSWRQTVDELAVQLCSMRESSSAQVYTSAVEELSQEFQQFKEDMS